MESLRILLVDDHILFRKGLASLMESRDDLAVVGEAGDGEEALVKARETMPDIILMDVRMPKCNGLEATRRIKREMPCVKIVMLTVSYEDRDLFVAIKNGAEGYLLKDLEPEQLFTMLERVRQGDVPLSGVIAAKILKELAPDRRDEQPEGAREELTPREIEILKLLTEGATNKEIGTRLFIAENTVKMHMANILEKLHLQNRIQAAVYAVRQGLLDDSAPCK
jgi:DNA-binding NarL/FixJ family response regulator